MGFSPPERAESGVVAQGIARTAARLFADHGYEATSVRMIVEAAGVTKPTLYYHFGSKEGLAQALMDRPLTALVATLEQISTARDDPEAVLARLFVAHFDFCREDPDRARFYYAVCFGPLAAGLAEALFQFPQRLDEPLLAVIRRLAHGGAVAEGREDDLLSACRGMITMAVIDFLYKDRTRDLGPALARRLVSDLLRGFGRRDGSGPTGGESS